MTSNQPAGLLTSKVSFRCMVIMGAFFASVAGADDIPVLAYSTSMELGANLSLPSDVGVGKNGKIYVVDSGNHQVAVFDPSGARIATIGTRGSGREQLQQPVGLGIDRSGKIYVADKGNSRLQVFSHDGRFRKSIELQEDGKKIAPVDVAVSKNGKELFVSSNNTHRILVYSSSGKFLRAWGGEGTEPGLFRFPATLAVDSEDNVLVVDVLNQRVQKFSPDGVLINAFSKLGAKPGSLFRPKGIALDAAGRRYVGDSFMGVIQVFDAAGEFLYALGADGAPAIFKTPVGMTVNGSRLFVTQMLAGTVLVLELGAAP